MSDKPDLLANLLKKSRQGEEDAKDQIASILAKAFRDPYTMSVDRVALEIRRAGFKLGVFDVHDDAADRRRRKAEVETKLRQLNREQAVLEDFKAWYPRDVESVSLQKPDRPRLLHLVEDINAHRVVLVREKSATRLTKGELPFGDFQTFIVQHDWTAPLTDAEGIDQNHIPLPYPYTALEFRLNDRPVVALLCKTDDEWVSVAFGVLTGVGWGVVFLDQEEIDDDVIGHFIMRHVRAISLLLETQLIVSTPSRSAHLSNQEPTSTAPLSAYEYHTLSLANRRAYSPSPGTGTHRSPRLHFRRGHWRHYATFKTWVRWTVAGDPDLGYIEKDYAL